MTVQELNRMQLEELKQAYATEMCSEKGEDISYGELADAINIPDEVIYEHYNVYDFTNDDFFCTANAVWVSVYRDTIEPHIESDNVTNILTTREIAEQYYEEEIKPNFGKDEIEWNDTYDFWKSWHTCDDTIDFYQYAKNHNAVLELEPPMQTLTELYNILEDLECWGYDEDYIYSHIYDNWTLEEVKEELNEEQFKALVLYWKDHGML